MEREQDYPGAESVKGAEVLPVDRVRNFGLEALIATVREDGLSEPDETSGADADESALDIATEQLGVETIGRTVDVIITARGEVMVNGEPFALRAIDAHVLAMFLANPGVALTIEDLHTSYPVELKRGSFVSGISRFRQAWEERTGVVLLLARQHDDVYKEYWLNPQLNFEDGRTGGATPLVAKSRSSLPGYAQRRIGSLPSVERHHAAGGGTVQNAGPAFEKGRNSDSSAIEESIAALSYGLLSLAKFSQKEIANAREEYGIYGALSKMTRSEATRFAAYLVKHHS